MTDSIAETTVYPVEVFGIIYVCTLTQSHVEIRSVVTRQQSFTCPSCFRQHAINWAVP